MFQGLDVVVGEQLSQSGFRIDGDGRGGGVRSVRISLRLLPGGRADDGTEIAARMVGHPLLQRLGVREAAVGLTVPDPLPVFRDQRHLAKLGPEG